MTRGGMTDENGAAETVVFEMDVAVFFVVVLAYLLHPSHARVVLCFVRACTRRRVTDGVTIPIFIRGSKTL